MLIEYFSMNSSHLQRTWSLTHCDITQSKICKLGFTYSCIRFSSISCSFTRVNSHSSVVRVTDSIQINRESTIESTYSVYVTAITSKGVSLDTERSLQLKQTNSRKRKKKTWNASERKKRNQWDCNQMATITARQQLRFIEVGKRTLRWDAFFSFLCFTGVSLHHVCLSVFLRFVSLTFIFSCVSWWAGGIMASLRD